MFAVFISSILLSVTGVDDEPGPREGQTQDGRFYLERHEGPRNRPPSKGPGTVAMALLRAIDTLHRKPDIEFQPHRDPSTDSEAAKTLWFHIELARAIETDRTPPHWSSESVRRHGSAHLLRMIRHRTWAPLPEAMVATLPDVLANRVEVDRELIRMLAKAPLQSARRVLLELLTNWENGELPVELGEPIFWSLGRVGLEVDMIRLYPASRSASPSISRPANAAFQQIRYRSMQARRFEVLASSMASLSKEYPADLELDLVEAEARIWGAHPAAKVPLDRVLARTRERSASRDRIAHAEALLGKAWLALEGGQDALPFLEALEEIAAPSLLGHFEMRDVWSRALFLRGVESLGRDKRDEAEGHFLAGIEKAPYEPYSNRLYGVFWGRFGLLSHITRAWLPQGHANRAHEVVRLLEEAIRKDPVCAYLGTEERLLLPEDEERPLSWIPLLRFRIETDDLAQFEEPIARMETMAEALEAAGLDANRMLLTQARLELAGAAVRQFEGERAQVELERALRAHQEIARDTRHRERVRIERRYRDHEVRRPMDPPGFKENPGEWWTDQTMVRIYLDQANVRSTLLGTPDRAKALLRRARDHQPAAPNVAMAFAVMAARHGDRARAERLLDSVEDSSPHFYNRACVKALLGELEDAVALLSKHLEENRPTEPARRTECRYMRQDPDLSSLRSNTRFMELTRE